MDVFVGYSEGADGQSGRVQTVETKSRGPTVGEERDGGYACGTGARCGDFGA